MSKKILPVWDRKGFCIQEGEDPEDGRRGQHCDDRNPVQDNGRGDDGPRINLAGAYRVNLKIVDRHLYAETHDGNTRLKHSTVERWFNSSQEAAELFGRWSKMGIAAKLSRYVGS